MTVIVDYGLGNLGSILNMLRRIGESVVVSSELEVIDRAKRLILPGVGKFDQGIENLHRRGLIEILNRRVLKEGCPVLGICLGLQLMSRRSEEGTSPGLGWLDAETVRFVLPTEQRGLRIPHMGWNRVTPTRAHHLLDGFAEAPRFYFVHSYHLSCATDRDIIGQTRHGVPFPAIVGRENILGTQFHPEKSHKHGMRLLKNFVEHDSWN